MCGIAGFSWSDERLVKAMTAALHHRGPDDRGIFLDDNVPPEWYDFIALNREMSATLPVIVEKRNSSPL